ERHVFRLVLDATQRLRRRDVAGRFEDSTEQDGHIVEFHSGAVLDRGNNQFRQIGVRAAEIEQKFSLEGICHRPSPYEAPEIGCCTVSRRKPPSFASHYSVLKSNCQYTDNSLHPEP